MIQKTFRSILLASMAVFIATMMLIIFGIYNYFGSRQLDQLKVEASLAAQGVSLEGAAFFEDFDPEHCRITWIDSDGVVLYDTKAIEAQMENHLSREEVQEALKSGEGRSSRYSTTLTEKQLYVAIRVPDGTVVRVSDTHQSVLGLLLDMLAPILLIIGVAFLLSYFLARRLAGRIVQPLNDMVLDGSASEEPAYEELQPLMQRLHHQREQIDMQSLELQQKQAIYEAGTSGMAEGLLLIAADGEVLSYNRAADAQFGKGLFSVGRNIHSIAGMESVRDLFTLTLQGEHQESVISLNDVHYRIFATPVMEEGTVHAVSMLFVDLREEEKAEQLRREFSANVSHELKTPLQTISGSAELIASGIVSPEDAPRFAEKIRHESERMIGLVEDIIRLSSLDEGGGEYPKEEVDMYEIAARVVADLTPLAEASSVSLALHGDAAPVSGVPVLLTSLVNNLCENAIKYNRPGGTAEVTVSREKDAVLLCVRDNGIGIPEEEQSRIFERFYRVDKSRSKEVGGTGLGLSIVKHTAMIHNAKIELESSPEEGTAVTVRFPAAE